MLPAAAGALLFVWASGPPAELGAIRERIDARDYAGAVRQAELLLAEVEAAGGPSSLKVQVLDLLVEARWRSWRSNEPETLALARQALETREAMFSADDLDLVPSLRNLAKVLEHQHQTEAARALYERIVAIKNRHRAEDLAASLVDMGNLLLNEGRYGEARPWYEKALAVQVATGKRESVETGLALNNLAKLHKEIGEYDRARSLYDDALALWRAVRGPGHPDVARTTNSLATLLQTVGEFSAAEKRYEDALAIWERHGDRAAITWVRNNLGTLYAEMGNFPEARSQYEQALDLSPPESDKSTILYNLARLHHRTNEPDRAGELYEQALAIRRRVHGESHPIVATTLMGLADVLLEKGDLDGAETRYAEAARIWQSSVPSHPDNALPLSGRARVSIRRGEFQKAVGLLQEALAIRERSFGPEHPALATELYELARAQAGLEDLEAATQSALRGERIGRGHLRLTIRSLAEREALRYRAVVSANLDLALSLATDRADPQPVWDALIRARALVLDEMALRHSLARGTVDTAIRRLMDDLAEACRRCSHLLIRGPDPQDPKGFPAELEGCRREVDRLEQALAAGSARFRPVRDWRRAGFDEVRARLPAGSALVAYARYGRHPRDPRGAVVPSYLAFVLPTRRAPRLVHLGAADEIEPLVRAWAKEIEVGASGSVGQAKAAYRAAGEALRKTIWDPLESLLVDAPRVFVVPDGALFLVSLYSLPVGSDRYLIEEGRTIHHVSAERDLAEFPVRARNGGGLLALGGAAYGTLAGPPAEPGFGNLSGCAGFQSHVFSPLPGTDREATAIADLWRSIDRRPALRLSGPEATESAFKRSVPGRKILHLATHGFFLQDRCASLVDDSHRGIGGISVHPDRPGVPVGESPLRLSGLALAGANLRSAAVPGTEDGILTAEEITTLDLGGAEWAVLSACDTGKGEVKAGEGVFGLQRAFRVAGARTVIMSLWAVGDEPAHDWMMELYRGRLRDGLGTAEAVHRASLNLLQRHRREGRTTHPFLWAGFVASGDWR